MIYLFEQTTTRVNPSFSFFGQLTKQGIKQSLKKHFTKPVLAAKVIAKHETGEKAYGTVKKVKIDGNTATVVMNFGGAIGGRYDTVVVLNVELAA